jgi:Putative adhesin
MKFRKVALFFLIVSFGLIVEGINVTRNVLNDESFEGFRGINLDGDFPFRVSRFSGPSEDFTEARTEDARGISGVEVSNAFGDVTVRRTSDPNAAITVSLRKEVFTRRSESAQEISDKVKLVVNREGGVVRISTTRNPKASYRVKTHIEIETPTPLDTEVTNRHGRIVVEGARAVKVSGEFDEMRVADITGDCSAKNRHGSLEVVSAALGCRVEVEHGDAHVERLMSASTIEVSHGTLNAVDMAALTTKLRFSDLHARKIAGDLKSEGEHSALRIDDVKGDVALTNRGDIDIQNVLGKVSIENRRGHVRLLKASGAVSVKNSFDSVEASDIGGFLEVTSEHGEIRVQRFVKGARLESDTENVDAADFEGALTVVAKRADVSLKPARKLLAPIDVEIDIGDVRLALSDSVNALLDASVERGDVVGEAGALKSSEQGKRLLKATLGSGGPLVKLRSRLGDIRVSTEDDLEVSEPNFPDAPEVDARFRPQPGADPMPARPIAPAAAELPKTPRKAKAPAPPAPPASPSPSPEGR